MELTITDTITADTIDVNDTISFNTVEVEGEETFFTLETLIVKEVEDTGDHIVIYGESLISGDNIEYHMEPDYKVNVMGAE